MKFSASVKGKAGLAKRLARAAEMRGASAALSGTAEALRNAALNEIGTGAGAKVAIERVSQPERYRVTADAAAARLEFGALRRPPRPWLDKALSAARKAAASRLSHWFDFKG